MTWLFVGTVIFLLLAMPVVFVIGFELGRMKAADERDQDYSADQL